MARRICPVDLSDKREYVHYEREQIIWDADLEYKLVLLCLNLSSDESGYCWPGLERIMQKCRMSKNTIRTALKYFVEKKIIFKGEAYFRDGKQTSNDYVIDFTHLRTLNDQAREKEEILIQSEEEAKKLKRENKSKGGKFQPERGQNLTGEGSDFDPNLIHIEPLNKNLLDPDIDNPDPDVCVENKIEIDNEVGIGSIALEIKSPAKSLVIPIEILPTVPVETVPIENKYEEGFKNRGKLTREDYFPLWYVLYRKALVRIGRSGEQEKTVHQAWLKRFPEPIPARRIEGGLKPIEAAKNPDLLEPIEEYSERVRSACGDAAADFVLGDHWHRIRIIHSSLKSSQEKRDLEAATGFDLGDALCGIKGMSIYLDSLDAESTLEWVETFAKKEPTIDDSLGHFFK